MKRTITLGRTWWWALGLLSAVSLSTTQAQVLYFDGVGRATVSNDALEGNLVEDDSLSTKKATSGYTLMDLGVNVKPSEQFKARAVLRARSTFGRFGGSGVALSLREFQLEGIVKKGIYYEIGDIDLEMTPYTLFNLDEMWHPFESKAAAFRREIVEYENFNFGNQWRLQGMQSQASFSFMRGVKKADLLAFATRTRPTDNLGIPDRLLAGGSAALTITDDIKVTGNAVHFFDIPGDEAEVTYENTVFTALGTASKTFGDFFAGLSVETGLSDYDFELVGDTLVSFDDFFYDVQAEGTYAPLGLTVSLGFRDVGPQFSSPSAQTRRMDPTLTPDLFSTVGNNTTSRDLMLFDRFAQENYYNATISPVLLPFLPAYGNTLPYGAATPNRIGFVAALSEVDSTDRFGAEAAFHSYNEIIGEGTVDLRSFALLRAGGFVNVGTLAGLDNDIELSVGFQQESTTRSGLSPVDLSSTLIDLGLSAEVVNDLHLVFGWKSLSSEGNEFLTTRDAFNGINVITSTDINLTNQVLSVALKFFFSEQSFFTAQYNSSSVELPDATAGNYTMNQVWLNYTVQF